LAENDLFVFNNLSFNQLTEAIDCQQKTIYVE